MSAYPFNTKSGPILIDAEITGPLRTANVGLVFDTGATTSLINDSIARYIGLDPANATRRVRMTTGTAVQVVPIVVATRLGALGRNKFGFPIIARSPPAGSGVDGLLGLDFLRQTRVAIDFATGQIELS